MKTLSSNGLALKAAMALRGTRYLDVALEASERLPENERLSEVALSRIVTGRKTPSPQQAEALAAVLDCLVEEIFPDVASSLRSVADAIAPASLDCVSGGNNSSNVWKTEGGEE